ncbi:cytochrome c peroxidase [Photobacterium aquimaris]|uniref:Cytochrome c551 peroxidase n=1 Tax=Photobacterium aquimaris TaxID=512643 RepID=A0A1Y6KVM7_9GAMM|nr:cytochrome c peroxidase [Photobacterium aquimaris]SMY16171.1 Cytochrome c551 peroxidase precursor [Photobacterium aquimaris]
MINKKYIKKAIVSAIALGIVGYGAIVYTVHKEDVALANKRLTALPLRNIDDLSAQAMRLLAEKGCADCHTRNSPLPFYAKVPGVKQTMQVDIDKANQSFELAPVEQAVIHHQAVSQVALAKLEYVITNNSMPIPKYLAIHWPSAYLNNDDRQLLLDWIRHQRQQYYPNPTAAPQFKNLAIQPIHTVFKTDPAKVAIGLSLYNNIHLSANNKYACSSCHSIHTGGTDNLPTSLGINNLDDPMNAPTVYDSAFNMSQFWNGRAADLAAQAAGPIFNPVEMGSKDWGNIIAKLKQDPQLVKLFDNSYKDGMTGANITNAIAEYEKTLITPNSRFDQYLEGNLSALSPEEVEGFKLFLKTGCQTCHVGQSMGGQSYEKMGVYNSFFGDIKGKHLEGDKGRYLVTHDKKDMHYFKVPNLRNIAITGPYFSGGRAATLSESVNAMAKYQCNTDFTPKETKAMVAYLKTLTGQYQGKTLTNPNCHDINGQQVCNSAKDQVWKQVTGRKLPTETQLN